MAARRVSKSSLDWAAFYERIPVREREVYKALKAKSDGFVNKVHSSPEALPKIDFTRYKKALPGLKMIEDFEKAYADVKVTYPKDVSSVAETIKKQEAEALTMSEKNIKVMEHEKSLSVQYLAKLKELPKHEDFTMEMLNEYFPWTKVKDPANPKVFPFTKSTQPENLTLNDSRGLNNLLARVGLKVKV